MNLPTKITLIRIFLIPLFVAIYLIDAIPYNTFIATGIFIVASMTDWLDGYLARKNNMVTDLGKFLDPIADKVLVSTALVIIVTIANELTLFVLIASIVIIARELIITCFRTIAATKKLIMAADMLGKVKTTLQLIGLAFYLPHQQFYAFSALAGDIVKYIGFAFLMLATLFAIMSAINYVVKNRRVLSQKEDD